MLGHRGCRLGNTYPEITQMQTRAISVSYTHLDVYKRQILMIPVVFHLHHIRQVYERLQIFRIGDREEDRLLSQHVSPCS